MKNSVVTNSDKCYFDPGSNILGIHQNDILNNPIYMGKRIDFLCRKKEALTADNQSSFVEHISTYSKPRIISTLDDLADWDKDLISKLELEGFCVTFKEARTKSIPATTSIYVELSR